ncbi:MAG TPA: hypothetical protein DDZ88_21145, partial [Verrucomicrobiales bacterium]|nr:hypothetical protein [Verrucomicrobiales bacterium]
PANVLINMKGQVKVADFGLAKVEEPGTHGLTKTGYAMGTPDFVAPEVLMLGSHIDGRADLYAVGVMLYQMLTGEVPRGAFKPATARLPGLDPRFDPIILKAMQSDREERYQSSTELRRDLDVILTVPLVRQDEPPTSAIPAAQVAQTPAQRSAAQKPPARSAGAPTRQPPAHAGEGTRAPVPPKKSSALLLLGLGAAALIGIGAFVMFSGSEKAKQSGPLSPLSGTSVPGTPETSKPSPPKAVATGQTIASKDAPSQGNPAATTKPSNPPPATTPAQPISKWQRVEPTEARWKQLGLEVKDGWVSLLASTSDLDKAWSISSEIKEKIPRDVAVRIRFRKVKGNYISLNCRYSPVKPYPEAIFWSDGRFQLRNRNTPLGAAVDLKEFKLSTKPTVGEEGILELAVIGGRVIARLNSTTVLEREVAAMSPAGPFEVRSEGHWIKDAEYMNLDGLADPLKSLGWVVPAASPAVASTAAPTPPPASPTPSAPASPSPSLPVSSSPPPATTMAAAPASELDQRLAALDASFQAAVERDANTAFKASIAALDKLYLTALDRALATASKGGKLEEALALREEKQRIEKGQGVPSEVDESTQAPGKVPDTLKTLRKTYRSTTAQHEATKLKAMQPLYDKYDQALAAVQTELTQAQKLDDAMRVKSVREQIAANRGGAAAPPVAANGPAAAIPPSTALARASAPPSASTLLATKDKPFTNSLGMKFVPVPGTEILMCIHETRRQDYAAFASVDADVDDSWKSQQRAGIPSGREDNHPVVGVNWEEASKFCTWLSEKEGKTYRLPTDREWSVAVGIGRDEKWKPDTTPETVPKITTEFPWGGKWPPSKGAGNYSDATYREKWTTAPSIDGYTDGFATTAPVMSFKPSPLGIFDLGGNAWEWVADSWNAAASERVLRGGSWFDCQDQARLASSHRNRKVPTTRGYDIGFRIVLDTRAPASTSGAATKPGTPTPAPAPAPATPAKSDFTNSLGMQFVRVTGIKTLFCIHETRYKDYAAYAAAVPTVNPRWKNQTLKNVAPKGPTDDHPVVIVSWEDAQAFCAWLSQKEGKRYRLPTDEEWSYAAGIGRDEKRKKDDTPATVLRVKEYPWGSNWPPSKGCENYGDESYNAAISVPKYLTGYDDGYPTTAPVMSFKPNRYGLYDMGGNVAEWCEDWLNNTQTSRVLRGSSWKGGANDFELLSSARGQAGITVREDQFGFRIVLETTE